VLSERPLLTRTMPNRHAGTIDPDAAPSRPLPGTLAQSLVISVSVSFNSSVATSLLPFAVRE